jgi:uncharacterized protein (DUF1501 family)
MGLNNCNSLSRRQFLGTAAMLATTGVVLLGRHAWVARAAGGENKPQRLIVILLRGAVDGLNVVVPYGDNHYYEYRPTIALPRRGSRVVLNLDGYFGLNPALDSLMPIWREGTLAFVHSCGSQDPTRSHFDAQAYLENGTPGIRTTADGWMNRTLGALPAPIAPTAAISLGPVLPRILSGKMAVANLPPGRAAARPLPLDNPGIERSFERLYDGADPLSRAYREGRIARKRLLADLEQDMQQANNGAPGPERFSDDAARIAGLIQRDSGIALACVSLGGWDTHINQGAADGQLANHLKPLGDGLAKLKHRLGSAYDDTIILVISEFGRTARENGDGGTDHGHGNVMWLMGGRVRGGRVYGRWSGLASAELYEGRDLAVTTDFREPIAQVLKTHLRLPATQIERIFPRRPADSGSLNGLIRI